MHGTLALCPKNTYYQAPPSGYTTTRRNTLQQNGSKARLLTPKSTRSLPGYHPVVLPWALAMKTSASHPPALSRKSSSLAPSSRQYNNIPLTPTTLVLRALQKQYLIGVTVTSKISNIEHTTLMTTAANQHAHKDVGNVHIPARRENVTQLQSTKHLILNDIHKEIGNVLVMKVNLSLAPLWIMEKAFETKLQSNRH